MDLTVKGNPGTGNKYNDVRVGHAGKRLIAEISFQLNESENNLNDDLHRLDHVRSEEKKLRSRLKSQRRQLDLLLSDASSTRNEQLEDFLLQKVSTQSHSR